MPLFINKENRAPGGIIEILNVALPLVISTASMQVMMFSNRIILSWHSVEALSAHAPAMILTFNSVCFFMGVATYTNVLVAQFYGSKRFDEMTLSLWQGFFFSLLAAILIIAIIPFGNYLIGLSSHPEHIKVMESEYYSIASLGGGLVVANNALTAFFTGRSKTLVTMLVTTIGNLFSLAVSYYLVLGAPSLGVPSMGIRGAAIGIICGNALIALLYLVLILSRENRATFKTWTLCKFEPDLFKKLMRYGLPYGGGFFIDIAAFTLFIFLIGNAGQAALAASNIALSLEGISFMPVLGIGIATSTLVGQYIGKKQKDVAVKVVYRSLLLSLAYASTIGALYFFMPDPFIRLFTSNEVGDVKAILVESYPLLKALTFFVIFDVINVIFSNAIKGAGDTRYQMRAMMLISWFIYVPGAVLILHVYRLPAFYAWAWASFYVLLLGVVFFIRFWSGKWRKIDMIGATPRLTL